MSSHRRRRGRRARRWSCPGAWRPLLLPERLWLRLLGGLLLPLLFFFLPCSGGLEKKRHGREFFVLVQGVKRTSRLLQPPPGLSHPACDWEREREGGREGRRAWALSGVKGVCKIRGSCGSLHLFPPCLPYLPCPACLGMYAFFFFFLRPALCSLDGFVLLGNMLDAKLSRSAPFLPPENGSSRRRLVVVAIVSFHSFALLGDSLIVIVYPR